MCKLEFDRVCDRNAFCLQILLKLNHQFTQNIILRSNGLLMANEGMTVHLSLNNFSLLLRTSNMTVLFIDYVPEDFVLISSGILDKYLKMKSKSHVLDSENIVQ